MTPELSVAEIKEIIRSAFAPLHCGVEDFDYQQKVRFRVFDAKDEVVLDVPEIKIRVAGRSSELHELLSLARQRLEGKGFALAEWRFPER
jgi:hypothetical protein